MNKIIELKIRNNRKRYGCDGCKRDRATEMFIGYNGNTLWICDQCYEELSKK